MEVLGLICVVTRIAIVNACSGTNGAHILKQLARKKVELYTPFLKRLFSR